MGRRSVVEQLNRTLQLLVAAGGDASDRTRHPHRRLDSHPEQSGAVVIQRDAAREGELVSTRQGEAIRGPVRSGSGLAHDLAEAGGDDGAQQRLGLADGARIGGRVPELSAYTASGMAALTPPPRFTISGLRGSGMESGTTPSFTQQSPWFFRPAAARSSSAVLQSCGLRTSGYGWR